MADVFVSYSRRDQDFVRRLHGALVGAGREVWVDWEGIPPSAKWMDEVRSAIDAADAFVFVVSPDSAASPVCRDEAEHALGVGKRIVPLVWRDTPEHDLPEAISAHNWLTLREGDDFEAGFARLLAALDTDLEWVKEHTRLVTRAREWEASGRERSRLLRGRDLERAEQGIAMADRDPRPTPLQTAYVLASRAAERRGARVRSAVLSGGLVVALVLAGFALLQRNEAEQNATLADQQRQVAEEQRGEAETQRSVAEQQRTIAVSRQLAAQSVANRDHIDLAALLAVRAADTSETQEAVSSLMSALSRQPSLARILSASRPIHDLVFAEDGATVTAAMTEEGGVTRWDVATGEETPVAQLADLAQNPFDFFAISPDATRAAKPVIDPGATGLAIWDLATGGRIDIPSTGGRILRPQFSPDGRLIAAVDETSARVWKAVDGTLVAHLPGTQSSVPRDVVVDRAGARAAVSDWDGSVVLWDLASITPRRLVAPGPVVASAMAFSPDSTVLAVGGDGGSISRWDTETGAQVGEPIAVDGIVSDVAFGGGGGSLIAYATDNAVSVVDVEDGTQVAGPLSLLGDTVQAMAFSADGRHVAIADFDGGVGLWDLGRPHPLATNTTDGPAAAGMDRSAIALSHDGRLLAVGRPDGTITVSDTASGATIAGPFLAHPIDPSVDPDTQRQPGVQAMAFSPDSGMLASSGGDGTVRRWDPRSGAEIGTPSVGHDIEGGARAIGALAFAPDASILASGGEDAAVFLWDPATGTRLAGPLVADTPEAAGYEEGAELFVEYVGDLDFSPDGRRLAVAGARSSILWDVASRAQIAVLGGHETGTTGVDYSPDGRLLASTDRDGATFLWDTATQQHVGTLRAPSVIGLPVFNPSGTLLVTTGGDGAQLWDVEGERAIGSPVQMRGFLSDAIFTDDATMLGAYNDGSTLRWTLDPGTMRSAACTLAGRDFTSEEWRTFMGDEAYRETCP